MIYVCTKKGKKDRKEGREEGLKEVQVMPQK
jgi:hypothetical protein